MQRKHFPGKLCSRRIEVAEVRIWHAMILDFATEFFNIATQLLPFMFLSLLLSLIKTPCGSPDPKILNDFSPLQC